MESYKNTGDDDKAMDAFRRTVIPVYTNVLQSSSTFTIQDYKAYTHMLRSYGETEKAVELERKEINELLETGANGGITDAIRAYEFAYQMYDQENYTEAISMATLALRLMEPESDLTRLKLQMKVLIGKAHYQNGNTRESFEYFKEVADWIAQHEATKLYVREYYSCCIHFMGLLQVGYVYECFLDEFGYVTWANIIKVGYFVITPLDLYTMEEEKMSSNDFKELTSESKIKDNLLPVESGNYALSSGNYYSSSESTSNGSYIYYILDVIKGYLNVAIKFTLRFTIVRALINILVVILKVLFMVSCIVIFVVGCCGILLSAVNLLVYLFITAFGYIETKFFSHVY